MMTLCKVKSQVLKKLGKTGLCRVRRFTIYFFFLLLYQPLWHTNERFSFSINHCGMPVIQNSFPSAIVTYQWCKILFSIDYCGIPVTRNSLICQLLLDVYGTFCMWRIGFKPLFQRETNQPQLKFDLNLTIIIMKDVMLFDLNKCFKKLGQTDFK